MKKNEERALTWIILILWPFYYLYDKLGAVLFWIMIGLISIVMITILLFPVKQGRKRKRTSAEVSKFKPVIKYVKNRMDGYDVEIDWPETFIVIDEAIRSKDYDFARKWLQKFAQSSIREDMSRVTRDRFKTLMIAFAKKDPLYLGALPKITSLVQAEPGILQTAIYPRLPQYNQETLRYVLYFAHELGDITRQKKGRSYQIFGPEQTAI